MMLLYNYFILKMSEKEKFRMIRVYFEHVSFALSQIYFIVTQLLIHDLGILEALFNNVFALKIWAAINVFDKV